MIDVNSSPRAAPAADPPSPPRRFSNREAEEAWSAVATTRTGVELTITPARAEDRDALEAFFDRVTPEDRYFRFLSGMRKVDEQRLQAMLRDDDDFSIDFLALDGNGEILATAMLVADADFHSAELALCTREDAKHKGISWALLGHAASYAEAMGIRRIYSIQSVNQTDALQLEREMGFTLRSQPDDPTTMLVEKTFRRH